MKNIYEFIYVLTSNGYEIEHIPDIYGLRQIYVVRNQHFSVITVLEIKHLIPTFTGELKQYKDTSVLLLI